LILGADGNFYGVTPYGGIHSDGINTGGTVFRIGPRGFAKLYDFCAQAKCSDGDNPAALVQGADGSLYGVTINGGTGFGTVFKVTTTGTLTTIYALQGSLDGAFPDTLVQVTDGNLYGTTGSTVFATSTG